MNLDYEKLTTDPKYWEAHAPKGAEYLYGGPVGVICWYKDVTDHGYQCAAGPSPKWEEAMGKPNFAPLIPKPTVKWDGHGYPPEGCECEYRTHAREGQTNFADDWENCVVQHASEDGCFLLDEDRRKVFMDSTDYDVDFRPILTKEEQDLKDLAEAINSSLLQHSRMLLSEELTGLVAEDLISEGWAKSGE